MKSLDTFKEWLSLPEEDDVQLLYVNMLNGKKFVFIGSPIDDDELGNIESVTFGECIPPGFVGMSMSAGPGTTAQ